MEGEEKNKVGSKRRAKHVAVRIDSDDDEPIGSFLKVKSKRNPKKSKSAPYGGGKVADKVLVQDEDLGGMDDTLASFRKKLRAPKKDGRVGSVVGEDLSSNVANPASQPPTGSMDDGDMASRVIENIRVGDGDVGLTVDKVLGGKAKRNVKRSKFVLTINSASRELGSSNVSECQKLDEDSSQNDKEGTLGMDEGSAMCDDDGLEDSLSCFIQKPQHGVIRKSSKSLSQIVTDAVLEESVIRKCLCTSKFTNEKAESSEGLHVSCGCMVAPAATDILTNGIWPGTYPGCNSRQEACSQLRTHGNSKPQNVDDVQLGGMSVGERTSGISCLGEAQCVLTDLERPDDHNYERDESVQVISGKQNLLSSSTSALDESSPEQKICSTEVKTLSPVCPKEDSRNSSLEEKKSLSPNENCCSDILRSSPENVNCDLDSDNRHLLFSSDAVQTGFTVQAMQQNVSARAGVDSGQLPQCENPSGSLTMNDKSSADCTKNKFDDRMSKDASGPNLECFSGGEETKGASLASDTADSNGSCAEDEGLYNDPESKTKSIMAGQRVARVARKRRLGDMAYEGDADWDILAQEQDFLIDRQSGDSDQSSKTREKLSSSLSGTSEGENGGAAAISAGLKARVVGPVENIKFKELLKRRGGLQEYLECRNNILSLWSKDVSRILPLSECGVSDASSQDGSSRASLIRAIYEFLDQCGYINFGVALEKAENGSVHNLKLVKKENFVGKSGAVSDANDGVCFILGRARSLENSAVENHEVSLEEGIHVLAKSEPGEGLDLQHVYSQTEHNGFSARNYDENGIIDAKIPSDMVSSDKLDSNQCAENEKNRVLTTPNSDMLPTGEAEIARSGSLCLSQPPKDLESARSNDQDHICDLGHRKRVIIVGAGPAGLTAARHMQRQGFHVVVLEARSRIGGRVYTDRSSLSVPVDLGASIITGVEADVATERRSDPSSLICAQLGLELTVLNSDCPLYDTVTGKKVPTDLDEALEEEFNSLLDDMVLLVAQKGEKAEQMSLEEGLEYALKIRRLARERKMVKSLELPKSMASQLADENVGVDEVSVDHSKRAQVLVPLERRVIDWHFANLEYGCAAMLKEVSLPYWNQDDVYGGFGGAHCMIKGGYGTLIDSLGEGLNIHLDHVVTDIVYSTEDRMGNGKSKQVKISTSNGREFCGDAVLITVPLGCLKAETVKFSPPLPHWKNLSIQQLGFGVLNKVVMEFSEVFWDDSIDYFGATSEETNQRGWCFMFWNVRKTVGAPVLIALVVGEAAIDGQNMEASDHVNHALLVLRKLFGETAVPDPVGSVVTDWGKDPYSYGAYSYVAVGSSGEDYDLLGRPVENCLFFAGEATCKEHPDTVGGAMMSGLREAVRIIDILVTGTDYTAEAESMEAAKRHSDIEKSEIRDIINRLEAVELSNAHYKSSLDQTHMLTKESLLKDLFYSAHTTSGRLHVTKQLLKLPSRVLQSFAGNKDGLSKLNTWMLDSMGKDGTQLLRHCVRLLVRVSNDLLAVRLSGIGKTVKEKVCVHTSRDIRAIASQLVKVWIELFRKEKALNGRLKIQRQQSVADSAKSRSSLAPGKPPLRTSHYSTEYKGASKVPFSKKLNTVKAVKPDTCTVSKLEVKPSSSQGSVGRQNVTAEDEKEVLMSEEEKAAYEAAEAARAAALAAAEAYASAGAKNSMSLQLPKIPSFHKFARREQYAHMDEYDVRRNVSGGAFGKQDCLSEIDSRNCRVRDWSVDFSAAGVNLDSSKMSADNHSQRSHSNEIACHFREHSGENMAVDSTLLTKAWVDSAGSVGTKDYNAIERWQCQAAAANSDFFHQNEHLRDEEDSNSMLRYIEQDGLAYESSASRVTVNKEFVKNQPRGAERIKHAVVDYVASLLMPLYKARKIDREGYKTIMKKTATKVMEQTTDAEKAMAVFEFLDFKRKNKIRAFVDKLIERHMVMKPAAKS